MGQEKGEYILDYGMPGSPARQSWEDKQYMRKAARKLIDRDLGRMSSSAQSSGQSKKSSKKTRKRVSGKR